MGVATGCGFKEIYRFPHTTYPYSSCICTFWQQHPYFFVHLKKFFFVYIYNILLCILSPIFVCYCIYTITLDKVSLSLIIIMHKAGVSSLGMRLGSPK